MQGRRNPGDRALAALALRQHGVLSHSQLLGLGLGRKAIEYRLTIARLHRIHLGVYAVGHRTLTVRGRWMAAVLACGPGAVLSHRAAAALWGIRATARSAIDVTAARGNRQRPGITVHRVRRLGEEDCTRHDRIPVTTIRARCWTSPRWFARVSWS